MYLIYTITLIVLVAILVFLWKEERLYRKNITHGLARKFWVLKERRRYVRFRDEMKIRYNIMKNRSADFTLSKTSDISSKGLSLVTYEKLKKKDCLSLELDIPGFPRSAKIIGQVVWTKDIPNPDEKGRRLFYIGLRFFRINPESEAMLLTHLSSLKRPEGTSK